MSYLELTTVEPHDSVVSTFFSNSPSGCSGAEFRPVPCAPASRDATNPPIICDGNKLTISAQNSTLGGAVLNAIRACTGAWTDVPADARAKRLFAELGQGRLPTILADFLSSTDFDYVIQASPSDPQKVQTVLPDLRTSDSEGEVESRGRQHEYDGESARLAQSTRELYEVFHGHSG